MLPLDSWFLRLHPKVKCHNFCPFPSLGTRYIRPSMSNGRIFAVGDIHGCAIALETMITALNLRPEDSLIVLGDVIDRGPDSRAVLQQLLSLRNSCRLTTILGNHEQMLLDVIDGKMPRQDWLGFGGAETLDSYGHQASLTAVTEEHLTFIRSWGDYHVQDNHFYAHGNYREFLPLAEQPWQLLRWQSLHEHTPRPHQSGQIAVLGHTANRQGHILDLGHLICIDTYCYGGGWLTALEAATGHLWQTNDQGEMRCDLGISE
jgi:serine/threonine protein phosphatase 1